ncbi:MAG: hypothetical protein ACREBA_09080 [Nitrosotalea sp.]
MIGIKVEKDVAFQFNFVRPKIPLPIFSLVREFHETRLKLGFLDP